MDYRLPYYMAYPMPLQYDDEKVERHDFAYIKGLYPDMAKRLLPYVEDECDRMEYEGSMLYDEYPDQLQLRLMCTRVYKKVKELNDVKDINDMTKDFITVMLFQEMYKRRCDHRHCKRKYY